MGFFALQFALDTSIFIALSKGIAQGRRRAVQNAILRCPGLRCMGLGLPHNLVAPYRAILRYYRCDTPYRAILFQGG